MLYMLSISDVLLIGMMHAHFVLHSRIVGYVVRVVDLWSVLYVLSMISIYYERRWSTNVLVLSHMFYMWSVYPVMGIQYAVVLWCMLRLLLTNGVVVIVIYDRSNMHNRNASGMKCLLSFCNKRMTKLQSDCLVVINGASGTWNQLTMYATYGTTYVTCYRIQVSAISITTCWVHWSNRPYGSFLS